MARTVGGGSRKMRSTFGALYTQLHMAHQRGDRKEVARIERQIKEERQSARKDPSQYYQPGKGRGL